MKLLTDADKTMKIKEENEKIFFINGYQ